MASKLTYFIFSATDSHVEERWQNNAFGNLWIIHELVIFSKPRAAS
jgi:hypothetical protein